MGSRNKAGRSDDVTAASKALPPANNTREPDAGFDLGKLQQTVNENAKAILELQTIPAALAELKAIMTQGQRDDLLNEDLMSDIEVINGAHESTSQLANELLDQETDDNEEETYDAEILNILQQTAEKPSYGPNLHQGVADSILRLATKKANKDETEKWKELFKPPENCKLLGIPKVNPEIWGHLGKGKIKDLGYQQFQLYVSNAAVCLAKIAEKIVTVGNIADKKTKQEILQLALDGAAMTCVAKNEISLRRRAECRPFLPKEMAPICSSSAPITENLFGDNVIEQIKNCKSTANLMKSRPALFRPRSTPYRVPNRNYSGNFQRNLRFPSRGVHRPQQRGIYQKRTSGLTRMSPQAENLQS